MSDVEESSGLGIVTSALTGVPEPIRKSFMKVLADLFGGLAGVPIAKLKQVTQQIEDVTSARSLTAARISQVVAEKAAGDPAVLEAAAAIYLPTQLRKVQNRIAVANSAADHLQQTAATNEGEAAADPDADWLNTFLRFADDASSDRMRDMFGRILAGQIVRPGAFGLATLRAVSELDQKTAEDFLTAWSYSVGGAVDHGPFWQLGEGYSVWKRLVEAGFMAADTTAQYPPDFKPVYENFAAWTPFAAEDFFVTVMFEKNHRSQWIHINFTRIGREIGALLPKPDYEKNLRAAALRLPKPKLKLIQLCRQGQGAHILWDRDADPA
ncbi:MAG: DUF2806 domain-containing protein [Gammaproteobacteria bacterium]|nr:DUF2806 domain-containing protein [Gammaproteobacteria bacterium]MBU1442806.1 DUF2806 domain-containing protein [Gammaproteobacteria bacterium]MBU2289402.1 DUF2806 domain-containing protein [Gammaproteobacteria bacterium]MBU2408834.1 DUF2806 domain-containing protein [Gammaproteobacteria bacterium]